MIVIDTTYISFSGRRFNKFGELIQKRTKWSSPAINKFQDKAKCLERQFNKFKIGDKLHVSRVLQ